MQKGTQRFAKIFTIGLKISVFGKPCSAVNPIYRLHLCSHKSLNFAPIFGKIWCNFASGFAKIRKRTLFFTKEQDPEPDLQPDTDPDLLIKSTDPKIRIRTKMSGIRNPALSLPRSHVLQGGRGVRLHGERWGSSHPPVREEPLPPRHGNLVCALERGTLVTDGNPVRALVKVVGIPVYFCWLVWNKNVFSWVGEIFFYNFFMQTLCIVAFSRYSHTPFLWFLRNIFILTQIAALKLKARPATRYQLNHSFLLKACTVWQQYNIFGLWGGGGWAGFSSVG